MGVSQSVRKLRTFDDKILGVRISPPKVPLAPGHCVFPFQPGPGSNGIRAKGRPRPKCRTGGRTGDGEWGWAVVVLRRWFCCVVTPFGYATRPGSGCPSYMDRALHTQTPCRNSPTGVWRGQGCAFGWTGGGASTTIASRTLASASALRAPLGNLALAAALCAS